MNKLRKISIEGVSIRIEKIGKTDYISLTDIARQSNDKPANLLANWMKNGSTILFLSSWEKLHNPKFNVLHMQDIKAASIDNRFTLSPLKWIEETGAVGIISKLGRYGGTYAHKDIALNFCYWLNPEFQVFMIKKFQELMEQEFNRRNLEWHISKITDNVEEIRNLLDTIPGQNPERNRILGLDDEAV